MDTPEQPPAMSPPSQPATAMDTGEPSSWPTVFGVIGIVIASLGILGGCCAIGWPLAAPALVTAMEESGNVPQEQIDQMKAIPPLPWMLATGVIGIVLGIMLMAGSIGLLRRRESGYNLCRLYCWIMIPWAAVSTPVNIMLTPKPQPSSQPGADVAQAMGPFIGACFGVALYIVFPIVMLVWFSKDRVKQEVANWETERRERI